MLPQWARHHAVAVLLLALELLPLVAGVTCSSPSASSIAHSKDPTCSEGRIIQAFYYCTTRCYDGYNPVPAVLNCFPTGGNSPAVLYPATFFCDANPCSSPQDILNASDEPCGLTSFAPFFPAHGSLCIPQCQNGFVPSVASLTCDAGTLTPPTFACEPMACNVSSSLNSGIRCMEPGDIFYHGESCTPRCDRGYAPTVASLTCVLGNMTPSTYNCLGLPCSAPRVQHAHPGGSCTEGPAAVGSGGVCTAQCAEGYEPWCSYEAAPRFGCALGCNAGALNATFNCTGRPCLAPMAASIANVDPQVCLEGTLIPTGSACTPICASGYQPSTMSMSCKLTVLSPASFTCVGLPCKAPVGIANGATLTCGEGSMVGHGHVCTAACALGYGPDVSTLSCNATELSPSTFQCLGLPCTPPTVENAADPACAEAQKGNISYGGICTAQCARDFQPLVPALLCGGGLLRPSGFLCMANSTMMQATRVENHTVQAGVTRLVVLAPLDAGKTMLCLKDASVWEGPQCHCYVLVASTSGMWRGPDLSVAADQVAELALAALGGSRAVLCYSRDRGRLGAACKLLGTRGLEAFEETPELAVTKGGTWHLALAAAQDGRSAFLCYQHGSSTCGCRVLWHSGEEVSAVGLGMGDEVGVNDTTAVSLAAVGLGSGAGVVCLADGRALRRLRCHMLMAGLGVLGEQSPQLAVGLGHYASDCAVASVALAALGPSTAVVCATDWEQSEHAHCRVLRTVTIGQDRGSSDADLILVGDDLEFTSGLTRYLVLAPAGAGRALVCYQFSEWAGQQLGKCRVLIHDTTLRVGDAVVLHSGMTWNLALMNVFQDTMLSCFTDSSDREHCKCKVLWGPWLWTAAEVRVCSSTDSELECVS